MCLPDVEILTFAISIFVPIYHQSVYQFRTKTPNSAKIGCFLLKIHPNYVHWGALICDENPRSLYQILRKSTSKGRHIRIILRGPAFKARSRASMVCQVYQSKDNFSINTFKVKTKCINKHAKQSEGMVYTPLYPP